MTRTSRALLPLALGCFFVTGASSLVFEVTWNRLLGLTFGSSTVASATVLAAFLGGLGLGAHLGGRVSARLRRPLLAFGLAEIGIGLYALAVPALLGEHAAHLYAWFFPLVAGDPTAMAIARIALVLAALLVPTVLMGATLPVLSGALVDSLGTVPARVGGLYAINTLGAVTGALGAGFVLLPALGLAGANRLAAGLDLAVGLLMVAFGALGRSAARPAPEATAVPVPDAVPGEANRRRVALACAATAGVATTLLELGSFRALPMVIGPSADAFSLMLAIFLGGLAAGAAVSSRVARKIGEPLAALGGIWALAALAVVGSVSLFPALVPVYLRLFAATGAIHGGGTAAAMVPPALALLPVTALAGMAFPVASRLVARSLGGIGSDIAALSLAGTLGNLAGALLASFWLLSWVGVRGTLLVAAALLLAASLVSLAASGWRARWAAAAAAALAGASAMVVAPAWDPGLVHLGAAVYAPRFLDKQGAFDPGRLEQAVARTREQIVFSADGRDASIAVLVDRSSVPPNTFLRVSGKTDGSTLGDMPTQIFSGALPAAYVPNAREALVIGWGTGVTAAALLELTEANVTVVELEPQVIEAGAHFANVTFDVLRNPRYRDRLRVLIDDGRSRLAADPKRYDIIVSEPSNPWMAGTANLFTEEMYRLARSRLNPGGAFVSWLQAYGLYFEDLGAVWRGLFAAFPAAHVYNFGSDLVAVSRLETEPLPVERIAALWKQDAHRAYFERFGAPHPDWLLAQLVGERAELLAAIGPGESVRDADNALGYRAARALHADTLSDNLRRLHRRASGVLSFLNLEGAGDEERSRLFARLARYAAATPVRRDLFLSEALAVSAPAPEAWLEGCRAHSGDADAPGLAGPFCREAYARRPDDPEVVLAYGKWLTRFSCVEAEAVLSRLSGHASLGGEAQYLRGACRVERGLRVEGLADLRAVAGEVTRWPQAARAADSLAVEVLIALPDPAALRRWISEHPGPREAGLQEKIAHALAQ